MKKLYASPLRVYLIMGLLALIGIWSGTRLPVSLFPNSMRPVVHVWASYGSMTSAEFRDSMGAELESALGAIAKPHATVTRVESEYWRDGASIEVVYRWGDDPEQAQQETEIAWSSFRERLPEEARRRSNVGMNNEGQGFLAISYASDTRSPEEVHEILDPIITPLLAKIQDTREAVLWNPRSNEIRIRLYPEKMAAYQLLPRHIDSALSSALDTRQGGNISVNDRVVQIQMPRSANTLEDLASLPILTPTGKIVSLADIGSISFGPNTTNQKFIRTSGAPSVILFASPKPGGNIKRMAEDIIAATDALSQEIPPDIKRRILIDPLEFIRSAIRNVLHEVFIGSSLAMLVLFVFIGSFRNVATTALEIPLSMLLAFILMRIFDMNLNLISLGGLALSAGMNVDASVVVIENIFRHFEMHRGKIMNRSEKLDIIVQAVKEVRFPVIAATIASLVVFMPLAFTADLSYAILGDLAKAVVFSHGLSAIVALVLVPTIRLHLMSREINSAPTHSPFEPYLKRMEAAYGRALRWFITHATLRRLSYLGITALLVGLVVWVLPRLPREILGKPDTSIVMVNISTQGHTNSAQMDLVIQETEAEAMKSVAEDVAYTFSQTNWSNGGNVMLILKDKRRSKAVSETLEKLLVSNPLRRYYVTPWNPSEFKIPDPPDLYVAVRGGSAGDQYTAAQQVAQSLRELKLYNDIYTGPNNRLSPGIFIRPNTSQWAGLRASGVSLTPGDLMDFMRVATAGRWAQNFWVNNRKTPIVLAMNEMTLSNATDVEAIPVVVKDKLVPLKALATVEEKMEEPVTYRINGRALFYVEGRLEKDASITKEAASKKVEQALIQLRETLAQYQPLPQDPGNPRNTAITLEAADQDVVNAVDNLTWAIIWSIALIFLTMVIQFSSLWEPLLVMVAVPLGIIGVVISLFVFQSNLSLNSALGVILLNGIAVANSIILVDFAKRLFQQGLSPLEAVVEAAQKRLRPILITSLTTILAMMPVAFGVGEGGKILQPLGIAVSGGLWVSMSLTLFLVPALHAAMLKFAKRPTAVDDAAMISSGGMS